MKHVELSTYDIAIAGFAMFFVALQGGAKGGYRFSFWEGGFFCPHKKGQSL
jgi:hypothetical protein